MLYQGLIKNPDRANYSVRDEFGKPAVPPCFTIARALSEVPSYSRQLTYAHTSWNTRLSPLTMPSAAHLATRISCLDLSCPDSLYCA